MRRFLYYFPGLPGLNPRMMKDRGILDRFTGVGGELVEHCVTATVEGPEGTGCVVAAGSAPPTMPSADAWRKGEKFWAAIETLAPRPEELAREVGIDGPEMQLADGRLWRVPLIHRWDPATRTHIPNLPSVLVPIVDGGKHRVAFRIRQEFSEVDAIASRVFEAFVQEKTVPLEQIMADAVAMLAINYRIGMVEAGLLEILDQETSLAILKQAIDLPRLQAQAEQMAVRGLEYTDPVIEPE